MPRRDRARRARLALSATAVRGTPQGVPGRRGRQEGPEEQRGRQIRRGGPDKKDERRRAHRRGAAVDITLHGPAGAAAAGPRAAAGLCGKGVGARVAEGVRGRRRLRPKGLRDPGRRAPRGRGARGRAAISRREGREGRVGRAPGRREARETRSAPAGASRKARVFKEDARLRRDASRRRRHRGRERRASSAPGGLEAGREEGRGAQEVRGLRRGVRTGEVQQVAVEGGGGLEALPRVRGEKSPRRGRRRRRGRGRRRRRRRRRV
mmetsp:Transcript_20523/g.64562  ORF Transcript_20523/g.64562 Transcript_20523/m.64562 type:complete len:265 (+) Transcript_20523:1010-1804(+)